MKTPPANEPPLTKAEHKLIVDALPRFEETARWVFAKIPTVEVEDLVQIGAVEAAGPARKYELARGIKFEAHAYRAVLGAMLDAAAAQARYTARARKLLRAMVDALPEPQPESEAVGLDELPVVKQRELLELREAIGAGILLGAAGAISADPETIAIQKEARIAVLRAVEKLSAEQQRIVRLHWFEHVSLNRIGPMLGLSASVIKKRHRAALVRIHALMDGWA